MEVAIIKTFSPTVRAWADQASSRELIGPLLNPRLPVARVSVMVVG